MVAKFFYEYIIMIQGFVCEAQLGHPEVQEMQADH